MSISSDSLRDTAKHALAGTSMPDMSVSSRAITLPLSHARACDPRVAGNKAANLARAAVAGLPTLPGFVITAEACGDIQKLSSLGHLDPDRLSLLQAAWEVLSHDGARAVVVRSSSWEDAEGSSMAGRFVSVLGVRTWAEFVHAVEGVIASGNIIDLGDAPHRVSMAVLVQPELEAARGGIMFGVDPLDGRRDRFLVSVVDGGPDRLVGGREDGVRYRLSTRGRTIEGPGRGDKKLLGFRQRRALANLALDASRTFAGPQDIEWAIDGDGKLWLFQSRSVAASGSEMSGPPLGPGPVAETFPTQPSPLEEDLG
ncbi:MAG: rifampicin phosphotransferase, partial [Actinomycetota bacterium]|nr:rifampicin phosphotransferase [Actinomycetota bacterium]